MKKNITFIFIALLTFVFNNCNVDAATQISQCSYSYNQSFSKYSKYTIDIYYYDNDLKKRYIKANLFTDTKINRVSMELENIKEGKNEDGFRVFGHLVWADTYAYFDSTSASNLMDLKSCPKNAYYVKDELYCFDNDGYYCNSKFGVEIIKSDNSGDYSDTNTDKLSCDEYSVTTGEKNENKCFVKFDVLANGKVDIYYKDVDDTEFSKLSDGASGFSCGGNMVSFTNTFLNNKILSREEFNKKYVEQTKDKTYCPKIYYYKDGGARYVVLEDSVDDLSDDYKGDGVVDGNGESYYYNGGINIGEDTNVNTCEDLFNDDFKKTLNQYMDWIRIIIPVGLIGLGIFDFSKAVIASKEDEMKKAQQTFIKRLIIGIAIFFVPTVVNLIIDLANIVAGGSVYGGVDCIKVDHIG